jgi:hypothetical protein
MAMIKVKEEADFKGKKKKYILIYFFSLKKINIKFY